MRRGLVGIGVVAAGAVLVALVYGCGETSGGDCSANGTCAAVDAGADESTADRVILIDVANGGDGGGREGGDDASETGGGGGDGADVAVDTFMCDGTKDPKDAPCVVDSTLGVFVSPMGTLNATGTKTDPLKTIGAGIAKAAASALKRVFVCAGTYTEAMVVGASGDGVAVYGGLDCSAWTYNAGNKVSVAPLVAGYALKLDGLTTGVTFEDVEFDSIDAQSPGESSVAVFANASVATFRRVVMVAGNGAAGAPGAAGVNYTGMYAAAGNNADGGAGGPAQVCTCTNGDQSIGGAGGTAGPPAGDGSGGRPLLNGGHAGIGGDVGCANGGLGRSGLGAPDSNGGGGAASWGSLTAQGWSSSDGSSGNTAPVAQGGGGGGGNYALVVSVDGGAGVTGGGGSGGCGGCGGGGGPAGRGGGSSLALLSYQSTIAMDTCSLTAHDGKNGGKGGDGQVGQQGGFAGNSAQPGCAGGTGGNAGSGGGGGGGAGGNAGAIGYVGSPPTDVGSTPTTKTFGTAGSGGPGGNGGGANNAGTSGKNGVAQAVVTL